MSDLHNTLDQDFLPRGEISYWCDGILIKNISSSNPSFRYCFNSGKKLYVFPSTMTEKEISKLISDWGEPRDDGYDDLSLPEPLRQIEHSWDYERRGNPFLF